MSRLTGLGRFLSDFVVGDDPQIAVWIVLALLATLVLSDHDVAAWWLLPLVVAATLRQSVLGGRREKAEPRAGATEGFTHGKHVAWSPAGGAGSNTRRVFAWMLSVTTLMVFAQAIIAGQFVSQDGRDSWITVHGVMADVTWVLALLTTIYGALMLRSAHPRLVGGAGVLFIALLAQTGIGHLITDDGHDWLIAVHVPLAFAIFAGALWLVAAARMTLRDASEPGATTVRPARKKAA